MSALINRASWWLLGYVAITTLVTVLAVVAAAVTVHWSLPWMQTWAVSAAIVGYAIWHAWSSSPPLAAVPPAAPPPEVPLSDLDHLRRLLEHGDISEQTYRRAVDQATRRYTPPPPPPPPKRRRW